jgi:hypothetical protein
VRCYRHGHNPCGRGLALKVLRLHTKITSHQIVNVESARAYVFQISIIAYLNEDICLDY